MSRVRRLLLLSILIAAGGAVLAVYFLLVRDDSLVRVQAAGLIRIGYAVEPPYAFLEADGAVTGEAPEIARRMAQRLRIPRIEWQQYEFGELIDALEASRIDVIAAGMFITPERQRRVAFSTATFQVRPGLLVVRGNPKGITSYRQSATRPELRVAVLAGAVEEQIMNRLGVPERRVLLTPDALTGRKAVESGLADALLLSEPTLRWMARREQLGRTQMLISPVVEGKDDAYGRTAFAFQLHALQLRDAWDAALAGYLGSAEHVELLARFGLARAPGVDDAP